MQVGYVGVQEAGGVEVGQADLRKNNTGIQKQKVRSHTNRRPSLNIAKLWRRVDEIDEDAQVAGGERRRGAVSHVGDELRARDAHAHRHRVELEGGARLQVENYFSKLKTSLVTKWPPERSPCVTHRVNYRASAASGSHLLGARRAKGMTFVPLEYLKSIIFINLFLKNQ